MSVSRASPRGRVRPGRLRSWRETTKARGAWNGAKLTIRAPSPARPAERTNSRRDMVRPPRSPPGSVTAGSVPRSPRADGALRVTVSAVTTLLDGLRTFMLGLVEALGYVGLAVLSLFENVVPPVPSEFVLPFAGFLVAEGRLNVLLVLLATSVGGFLGTTAFYWLGRVMGEERVRAFIARY